MTETHQDYIVRGQQAQETWDHLKQTKFTDEQIQELIWLSMETGKPNDYCLLEVQQAQAMIAYNNMIDARIERAQRTWGAK